MSKTSALLLLAPGAFAITLVGACDGGGGGSTSVADGAIVGGAGGGVGGGGASGGGVGATGGAPGGSEGGAAGTGGAGGTGGRPMPDAAPPGPDDAAPPGPDDATPPGPDDAGPGDASRPVDGSLPDAAPVVPPVSVVINEVDCHGRDWIELYNLADEPADLSGFELTDALDEADRHYALPAGTMIGASGFFSLRQQDENDDGFEFGIGCGGDETVALLDATGELLDAVTLPPLGDRYAWGRLPDGDGPFVRTEATRGQPNVRGEAAGARYFDPLGRNRVEIQLSEMSVGSLAAAPYEHVPARVRLGDGLGDVTDWYDVGLHIKGRAGSFRTLDRKSALRIDVNRYERGQEIEGLKNLTLNNMVQDPSVVHEATVYTLFREVGIPAPRNGYASVSVNGQEFGLYLMLETYDDVYLSENFETTTHLYEGLYGQDLYPEYVEGIDAEEGDPLDRTDYQALIMALDLAAGFPGELMERTEALVDWPQVALVMATELYVGHWDGYASTRNNWYMHFDTSGVMRLLPWGTDQTWAYDHPLHQGGGRLFMACMADFPCRELYDRSLGLVQDAVDRLDLPGLAQAIYDFQRPALDADPRKEFPIEHADGVLAATLEFMRNRSASVGAFTECLELRIDPDGDGFICDQDCHPDDPTIYPGATDTCGDGIDQDCNGRPDDDLACPDCQERFLGPHRYLVCPNPRDWAQAEQHCVDYGAHLAEINSAYENLWLWYNGVTTWNQWWYIGGNDLVTEGEFNWTTGNPLSYVEFLGGQPDNSNDEDCLHYFESGPGWNDIACGARLGVLCEDTCRPGEDSDSDGHLRCGDDCHDGDPGIHPGAEEVCNDFVDQDCDGTTDEGPGGCDCVERFQGPHRYLFCHNGRTWHDGRAHCQSVGMDLVLVDNEGENTWLANQGIAITGSAWWLGHTDQDHEGNFTGWDGAQHFGGLWNGGEPNNAGGNEHCAHFLDRSNLWNDIPCDAGLPVICEETCPEGQDEDRDGVLRCGGDCDDDNRQTRPGVRDTCGDGLDNDCSGVVDDGRCE